MTRMSHRPQQSLEEVMHKRVWTRNVHGQHEYHSLEFPPPRPHTVLGVRGEGENQKHYGEWGFSTSVENESFLPNLGAGNSSSGGTRPAYGGPIVHQRSHPHHPRSAAPPQHIRPRSQQDFRSTSQLLPQSYLLTNTSRPSSSFADYPDPELYQQPPQNVPSSPGYLSFSFDASSQYHRAPAGRGLTGRAQPWETETLSAPPKDHGDFHYANGAWHAGKLSQKRALRATWQQYRMHALDTLQDVCTDLSGRLHDLEVVQQQPLQVVEPDQHLKARQPQWRASRGGPSVLEAGAKQNLAAAPKVTVTSGPGRATPAEQLYMEWDTNSNNPLIENYLAVHGVINSMHSILDAGKQLQRQNEAAITMQRFVRGFIVRQRRTRALWGMHAWRREQHTNIRACLLGWIRRRQMLEIELTVKADVRQRTFLQHSLRGWYGLVQEELEAQQAQVAQAVVLMRRHILDFHLRIFINWYQLTNGPRGMKSILRKFERRYILAKKKLEKMQQDFGWEGEISKEMVVRELENEAVLLIKNRQRALMMRIVWREWRKCWNTARIMKGQFFSQGNSHSKKLLLQQVFTAFGEVMARKKQKWGDSWPRRKLRAASRQVGRSRLLRRSLQHWSGLAQQVVRLRSLVEMMSESNQANFFQKWREQTKRQRSLKTEAISKWQQYSRRNMLEPWLEWKKYVLTQEAERLATKGIVMGFKNRMKRRMLSAIMRGFKENLAVRKFGKYGDISLEDAIEELKTKDQQLEETQSNVQGDLERLVTRLRRREEQIVRLLGAVTEESTADAGPGVEEGSLEQMQLVMQQAERQRAAKLLLGGADHLLESIKAEDRLQLHSDLGAVKPLLGEPRSAESKKSKKADKRPVGNFVNEEDWTDKLKRARTELDGIAKKNVDMKSLKPST
ncbi:hypothetical protein CYMTET_39580 [Cymbomonas tetramitiformis]|uniref:Uncharacterized protein n=1 Tax=Cymbomonas tetramitiformis TaxID=36881 RepID=A0AAE0CBV3_9CHLO|nr:hypothetical protein CYMTET_39580 [Cymbomonas tetramitiformis]